MSQFTYFKCKVSNFKFNETYKNGSGKLVFQNEKNETLTISFITHNKEIKSIIEEHPAGVFDASGDLEMNSFQDRSYAARCISDLKLIDAGKNNASEERGGDEIPF